MEPETVHRSTSLTRRRFAGLAGAVTAGTVVGTGAAAGTNAATEQPFAPIDSGRRLRRPNILAILADDLGSADLGCYGTPDIRTPHLDGLARSGVRYTQGYSASAVCSPNRVALYTGRHPGRIAGGLPEPIADPNSRDGIPPDHPTLASLIKEQGYATAMFGKWHGGYLPWFGPLKSGWDEFYGNYSGAVDYFSKLGDNGDHDLYDGEEPAEDPRYYTDIITEKVTGYLNRRHDQPWLLNVNFNTPHWPWEGPRDKAVSDELAARMKAGEENVLFHQDGGSLDTYRKMVESLDTSVGRILNTLRRTGQLRDTLIFFASDNGGERFSYQWPLTGEKASVNEGGLRVPMIVSWPGQIAPRQRDDTPVYTTDWTATFLELAGAEPDPGYPPDGASLVQHLFRRRGLAERDMFWRMEDGRALRRGDLKYVRIGDVDHLYDLSADVREQADLAALRPDDLAALRKSWEDIDATLLPYETA